MDVGESAFLYAVSDFRLAFSHVHFRLTNASVQIRPSATGLTLVWLEEEGGVWASASLKNMKELSKIAKKAIGGFRANHDRQLFVLLQVAVAVFSVH